MLVEFHIIVTAEIRPGREDPSAEAGFSNSDRAAMYAKALSDEGRYSGVFISSGGVRYELDD